MGPADPVSPTFKFMIDLELIFSHLGFPNTKCMKDGRCSKRYPRAFAAQTTLDIDSYPTYCHPDNGRTVIINGVAVDNRWIVPYCAWLSRKYDCHINVEVCSSVGTVKYIHKYVYKGPDCATIALSNVDEIQQHIDSRYISASEAAYHLHRFPMHQEVPNVVRLTVHLPNEQLIVFNPDAQLDVIAEQAQRKVTTLMGFFTANRDNIPGARHYTYQEFPQHFVWKDRKAWAPRKKGFAYGRMYFVPPIAGEKFYLRMLLTVAKGPTSFADLRMVEGNELPTFKDACLARGLLEDDDEWIRCLREGATFQTGHGLRNLFATILLHCNPTHPHLLWHEFKSHLCDDLRHRMEFLNYPPAQIVEENIYDYGLHLLELTLLKSGKRLADFRPMPLPVHDWEAHPENRLIMEELNYNRNQELANATTRAAQFNPKQAAAYEAIIASALGQDKHLFFLHGPAGTGKTFVYNTICARLRGEGKIVLCVASSGIASQLLIGGRTAHSRFKIPLDIHEDSTCSITVTSQLGALLRETSLIIWDEVPMQHRFCAEAVDRTMRDVCNVHDKPFGGVTVVFGGDFQQILPVVPHGSCEDVVGASLSRSRLWQRIQVLHLRTNMRLDENPENREFANWLLDIGSGRNLQPDGHIKLKNNMSCGNSINDLVSSTYPAISEAHPDQYFLERTILSSRNDDVDDINRKVLRQFPGEERHYFSADTITPGNLEQGLNVYPVEYLNSLKGSGLPLSRLTLKEGAPLMLLQNLNPLEGLCNGTRMVVIGMRPHVLQVRLLEGSHAGQTALIPRITLTASNDELPIPLQRRQFPVRLAFAMTINKSQGQSVRYVGIDLRSSVFTHGQLYVALSRSTSGDRIKLLLPPRHTTLSTPNIVYPEVLLS